MLLIKPDAYGTKITDHKLSLSMTDQPGKLAKPLSNISYNNRTKKFIELAKCYLKKLWRLIVNWFCFWRAIRHNHVVSSSPSVKTCILSKANEHQSKKHTLQKDYSDVPCDVVLGLQEEGFTQHAGSSNDIDSPIIVSEEGNATTITAKDITQNSKPTTPSHRSSIDTQNSAFESSEGKSPDSTTNINTNAHSLINQDRKLYQNITTLETQIDKKADQFEANLNALNNDIKDFRIEIKTKLAFLASLINDVERRLDNQPIRPTVATEA